MIKSPERDSEAAVDMKTIVTTTIITRVEFFSATSNPSPLDVAAVLKLKQQPSQFSLTSSSSSFYCYVVLFCYIIVVEVYKLFLLLLLLLLLFCFYFFPLLLLIFWDLLWWCQWRYNRTNLLYLLCLCQLGCCNLIIIILLLNNGDNKCK